MRGLRAAALALGVAIVGIATVFLGALAGSSGAAVAVAPVPTGEPVVTGNPQVGQVLRTTRGSWTGTEPITYRYRWYRCEGRGAPDASDCLRIANAANATYVVRQSDVGFRIRSQVRASNADGAATSTSNPTEVVQSARPTNVAEPTISGTAAVGNRLTANRGTWVGDQPMTFAYQWLRCGANGTGCAEIPGANDTTYVLVAGDAGRTIRVRVTARNDSGSRSALSNPTAVVRGQQQPPPTGNSVDVRDLRAAGDRLVVAQVRFSPNPVTSRTAPITARVQVTNRDGRVVRGALVFMRATPRVVRGATAPTDATGWVTLTLVPNRFFPVPRDNFNLQFFVKAYRAGDPGLGGIAGYRLVQVRLADA